MSWAKTLIIKFLIISMLILPGGVGLGSESGENRAAPFPRQDFTGLFFTTHYPPDTYDLLSQNWAIVQDHRGVLYVGNNGGLMEYDGVSWRHIIIKPNQSIRSLDIDPSSHTIYVGACDQLGYLAPDENHLLTFISLKDKLEEPHRSFSFIYQVMCSPQGVFFRTDRSLIRWHQQTFTVWENEKTGGRFKTMLKWKERVIVQKENIGLLQIEDTSSSPFRLLPGSEVFRGDRISLAAPFDTGNLLIGVYATGFFLYDGKKATPWQTDVQHLMGKTSPLFHGIGLSGHRYALAFDNYGLVIIDAHGHIIHQFVSSADLDSDNKIKYLFQDNRGSLWLALEKGITRIDYALPFTFFNKQTGLDGLVLSVTRHQGQLVAGTTRGLYFLESTAPGFPSRFRRHETAPPQCRHLLSSPSQGLFAASDTGLFFIDGNNTQLVGSAIPYYFLLPSRLFPGYIWAGNKNGLSVLHEENGQWRIQCSIDLINTNIASIVELPDRTLWLGTHNSEAIKLDFPPGRDTDPTNNINQPRITRYDKTRGIFGREVFLVQARERILACSNAGIFRFDPKEDEFIPDDFLGKSFTLTTTIINNQPVTEFGENVFRMVQDENNHLWFHAGRRNYQAIHRPDGTYDIENTMFLRLPRSQVNMIYPGLPIIWLASDNGLFAFTTQTKKNIPSPFYALVRKVTVGGRTPIYLGSPHTQSSPTAQPILDFTQRNIKFEVAAPYFDQEAETQYRYFLEGYDEDWSDWTYETVKDYTNLGAGNYCFRVSARNIYHINSNPADFYFQVLPPWYLAWWMFFVYAVATFYIIMLIVKLRSHKLLRDKQHLEVIIEERTREIYNTNINLQQKTSQLEEQSQKLKEMDKMKSRFFANISHEFRTPLTLIMGPLEHIREECSNDHLKQEVKLVYRNASRLLNLINQLLDLSRFESGSMKLQAIPVDIVSFIRVILEPFQFAAQQRQLSMSLNSPSPSLILYCDPEKMEKIIANLLSNAVKFTPPGGQIVISISCVSPAGEEWDPQFPGLNSNILPIQGQVIIMIRDTGLGIPDNQVSHIFDRFYQADNTVEHAGKGSGIGLALVKEMVELHHGTMSVQSKKDQGSVFTLGLPLGKSHLSPQELTSHESTGKSPGDHQTQDPPPVHPGLNHHDHIIETLTDLEIINESNQESPILPDPLTNTNKNIILVVEDNTDLRTYIRQALEPGYIVEEAANGSIGIEKAFSLIPDLVISDIMMPEKDGYELCHEIKTQKATSHIPVILLTAKASEENIVQGLETGADDYITKPFNTKVLCARIKNLIELRHQLQLNYKREMVLQPTRLTLSKIDREFMDDLQKVIDHNISDPEFNVEELSRKLYMSRVTVYRKIQALCDETPTDFIRSYRLKRAAQLLQNHFGSVTEVAFEVGFSSRAYFTKCFKEKFHRLPSEFSGSGEN